MDPSLLNRTELSYAQSLGAIFCPVDNKYYLGGIGNQGGVGPHGYTGPQGPAGIKGAQGIVGIPGLPGPQGPTGIQGIRGIQGIQGITGPTGLPGIQGVQGDDSGITGPKGITGYIGPMPISGTNNSDYIYWNNGQWVVGSQNVTLGTRAGHSGSVGYNKNTVAIGYQSGMLNQGNNSVSLGRNAGCIEQGKYSIAIGNNAGSTGQGTYSVAIGNNASNGGYNYSVALGNNSLNTANNQIMLGTATDTVVIPGSLSILSLTDNSNTICYVPFSKTGTGQGPLYIDNTIGPFTYNPSTGALSASNLVASTITTPTLTCDSGQFPAKTPETDCSYSGTTPTSSVYIADSQTTGNLQMGTAHTTGNINIGNGTYWNGGSVNIGSGGFTGSAGCTLNLMSGENTGTGLVNIGGSSNTAVNIMSPALFSKTISTSTTLESGSISSTDLGYKYTVPVSFVSSFSGPGPVDIGSFSVNETTFPYGTYIISVYLCLTHKSLSRYGYSLGINTSQNSNALRTPYSKMYYLNGEKKILSKTEVFNLYPSTFSTLYISVSSASSTSTSSSIADIDTTLSKVYVTRIA